MVEPPEKDRQPPDKAGWIENLAKRSTGLPKDEASSSDTGSQGEKSPYKDPVDVLRYLFGEQLYYSDPEVPECSGGCGWGARKRI